MTERLIEIKRWGIRVLALALPAGIVGFVAARIAHLPGWLAKGILLAALASFFCAAVFAVWEDRQGRPSE